MRLIALTVPLLLLAACTTEPKIDDSSTVVGDDTNANTDDSTQTTDDSQVIDDTAPVGTPNIVLSATELDLGVGVPNVALTVVLSLQNTGDANLEGTVSPDSGYSVDQGNFSIPASGSQDITISFSAPDVGSYPGSLTVASNDPDSPSVTVALLAQIENDSDQDGSPDSIDCQPFDSRIYPGATEVWYDGIDQNCDGLNDYDQDQDGYDISTDCNDQAASAHPGGTEIWYNGIDEDCDGRDDDQDQDGYGVADDCNDLDASLHPGAVEIWYDGIDQNCDGNDADQDGDGYDVASDCNDLYANINPGATEVCDGIDNNCDGQADTDAVGDPWYTDADGDGYGSAASVQYSCTQPAGTVSNANDCDDVHNTINPAALEVCDGLDNNCDGAVDINVPGSPTYYQDADGDTYGGSSSLTACSQPAGYVTNSTDCDDSNAAVHPGATEIWYNNIDENCDGNDDDQDGDGSDYPTDCNDSNAAIYPGAIEICDNIDNDCSTIVDDNAVDATAWYLDADGDSYGDPATEMLSCTALTGYITDGTDCNDSDIAINPGATEIPGNTVDENCDGSLGQISVSTAAWTVVGSTGSQYIGASGVAMSADGNADGDAELLIGSTAYSNSTGAIGFHDNGTKGAAVSFTSAWAYPYGSSQGHYFSSAFTTLGDVDGNGTQDYAGSSPYGSNGDGRIYVFDLYDDNGNMAAGGETLSTQSNFLDSRINGMNGEGFGSSIASGDMNGDGIADLAVGGSDYYYATGAVWLFDGVYEWWTGGEFDNDFADGFIYGDYDSLINNYYAGYGYEYFGTSTAIGDFDGDGEADLISCAPNNNYGVGACWVVAGQDALYAQNDDVTTISSTIFTGSSYGDNVGGHALSLAASDLDGDGDAEAVIGLDGANNGNGVVAVLWGGSNWSGSYDINSASAALWGDGAAGAAVYLPGDMNADGIGEIMIGAPEAEATAGRAYMVSGDSAGTITLSTQAMMTWLGANSGDALGTGVAGGQDLDHDGVLDVALSAPNADNNGSNSGTVYILPGSN